MADLVGVTRIQWTAGSWETSQEFSDFTAHPASHDTHDTHNPYHAHNAQDLSFFVKIDKAESIRFGGSFKSSATVDFQPTERHIIE